MEEPVSVLLVDDNPSLLKLTKLFLEQSGYFSVTTVKSAPLALRLLDTGSFDAIISDYQMPEMDGIAFLKQIRSQGNKTPFIIFTGKGREEVVIDAIDNGVDFYIQKGGDPQSQFTELAYKVKRAIEQQRVGEALMSSEERYRSLIETTGTGFVIFDRDHRVITANNEYIRLTGHSDFSEIQGVPVTDWIASCDRGRYEQEISNCIRMGQIQGLEVDYITPYGSVQPIEMNASVIQNGPGIMIQSLCRDITSRKQVERALRASEEKYRNLIENANEVIVVAQDGMLRLVNHQAEELTGYSEQELLSMSFDRIIHPDDRAMVMQHYRKRLAGEEPPCRYSFRVISRDGTTRWVEISIVLIEWDGRPATLNFFADITERKQTEDALTIQHELSLALGRTTSLDEAFNEILLAALRIEGLDAGGIYMADPDTGAVDLVAHQGVSPQFVVHTSHYDSDSPQLQQAHTGIPFFGKFSDIITPGRDEIMDNERLKAFAAIPAMYEGKLISILNLASHTIDEIPISTRQTLETLALQVGTALFRIRSQTALRESEARYRDVVEDQTEFICRFLPDGTHVFANEAYCRYFGIRREEVIGSRFRPDIPEEDQDMLATGLSSLTPEHPVITMEQRTVMKDGTTRWQRWVDRGIFDASGSLVEYQSVGRDTTELKERENALKKKNEELMASYLKIAADEEQLREQVEEIRAAQEARRESEQKFRAIFNQSFQFIGLLTLEGILIDANQSALDSLGTTRDAVIGKPFWETPWWTHSPELQEKLQKSVDLAAQGQFVRFEATHPGTAGTIHEIDFSLKPYMDESGRALYLIPEGRDISELKKAENALLETERRLEDIINFLPDATLAIDQEGRVITWNRAIEEMTGVPASDMVGKGNYEYALPFYGERRPILIDLVMKDDEQSFQKYSAVKKDGDALTAETSLPRIGGKDRILWGKAVLFRNPQGSVIGAIESIRDITERKKVESALAANLDYLDQIFSSVQGGIVIIDAHTHEIIDLNPYALNMMGTTKDRVLNKVCHHFICPAEQGRCPITDLHQTVDNSERVLLTEDGKQVDIIKYVVPFSFHGRDCLIETFLDNTERKKAVDELQSAYAKLTSAEEELRKNYEMLRIQEQSLRASEENYRTVFENTGTATVVIAEDSILELVNEGFVHLSGFSREEIQGKKKWTEFVLPEDLERMQAQHRMRRLDREKALTHYEFRFVTKGGDIRSIYLFIDIIPGTKKSVASLLDITDRKRAEELFQTVFENTGTAMIVLEENAVISHINEEMEKVLGYGKEELESRMKWPELVVDEDRERMIRYHRLRRKEPGASPKDYEFRFIHKNGEIRDAALTVALIPGTRKSVGSIRDITEMKKLNQRIRERTEQVEQLLRQKDEFIAQAGHDLKTPLTPIIALLPHIIRKEKDPDLRALLEIVMGSATSMKNLTSDILTLAQLNQRFIMADIREMVLADEIEKVMVKHAWIIEKKGYHIENIVDKGVRIRITPFHLASLLDNLVSNAVRYSTEGGTITLSSRTGDGVVAFSVADTGIGLSPEEIPRIFDEFYTADTSRHHRDSSGLGLAIVKRIVHLYGGNIHVESPGKGLGSTFTVTLPEQPGERRVVEKK
jgi:PAS domain S-box-containing protein